jgi:hypothetical protein
MLNDWVETPGDTGAGAPHRAAGEWPSDPGLSRADGRTDDTSTADAPASQIATDNDGGRQLAARGPGAVSETDLLYWFG